MRRVAIAGVFAAVLLSAVPAHAASGDASPNMRHVATVKYDTDHGMSRPLGTDIEFARISGRDYAFAGTFVNGLQIIDITNPRRPELVAVYDCAVAQGDVQVFRRGKRTIVAYAADDYRAETNPSSRCFREAGVDRQAFGTFFIDVTDPWIPRGVGFVEIPVGSHNQTIHPSGRFLYNSNADSTVGGGIEVFDIRNLASIAQVAKVPLNTGLESHDITFSADGRRAYSAALTHTLVLDTSSPARPKIIGTILDPAVNIHHQADPITIDDPLLGRRTFLIISDELNGAAGNVACPGGGLHVYDITGDLERAPVKVGFWAMPDARPTVDSIICTSHVLRLYPKQKVMTIGWYAAGVRVVDVSGLAGVSAGALPSVGNGGAGMKEIGYYMLPNAETWTAKTNRIAADGSFYLFGNDMNRGLDVYRFDAEAPRAGVTGLWLTPDEASAALPAQRLGTIPSSRPYCLVLPAA